TGSVPSAASGGRRGFPSQSGSCSLPRLWEDDEYQYHAGRRLSSVAGELTPPRRRLACVARFFRRRDDGEAATGVVSAGLRRGAAAGLRGGDDADAVDGVELRGAGTGAVARDGALRVPGADGVAAVRLRGRVR